MKGTKFVYLKPSLGNWEKKDPIKLKRGLRLLSTLWERNLKPEQLRPHQLLTLFALMGGNTSKLASQLDLNRNTLILVFSSIVDKNGMIRARKIWNRIVQKTGKNFQENAVLFYKRLGAKLILKSSESKILINLWLMGFPFRILRWHYLFWGRRKGLPENTIWEKLGVSFRTYARIKSVAYHQEEFLSKWLGPLKINEKEWYPKPKVGTLRHQKKIRNKNKIVKRISPFRLNWEGQLMGITAKKLAGVKVVG